MVKYLFKNVEEDSSSNSRFYRHHLGFADLALQSSCSKFELCRLGFFSTLECHSNFGTVSTIHHDEHNEEELVIFLLVSSGSNYYYTPV